MKTFFPNFIKIKKSFFSLFQIALLLAGIIALKKIIAQKNGGGGGGGGGGGHEMHGWSSGGSGGSGGWDKRSIAHNLAYSAYKRD